MAADEKVVCPCPKVATAFCSRHRHEPTLKGGNVCCMPHEHLIPDDATSDARRTDNIYAAVRVLWKALHDEEAPAQPDPPDVVLAKVAAEAAEEIEGQHARDAMFHRRMMEADSYWQGVTGEDLTWPDLGSLLVWLMERRKAYEAVAVAAKAALEALESPEPYMDMESEAGARPRQALKGALRRLGDIAPHPTTRRSIDLIGEERRRQIEALGYTPSHDRDHAEELALAGAAYAIPSEFRPMESVGGYVVPKYWPWRASFYKPEPEDRVRELVKAGALIAAAIDAELGKD